MRHIAPLLALPTTLVFAACFNPRAGEMADGNDTDADDTSAGTSAGPSDGTATAPTTNDTTPTTADDDPTAATSEPGETEDADCIEHDDCTDPLAPFCTAGTCVACDETPTPNDACASRYPDTPLCDAGECVQCTAADTSSCDGNTPICDTDARTCTACTYHYQCPDSACHIAEGSCMPTDTVWTVNADGGADYTTVSAALAQIGSGQQGTIVITGGSHYYQEQISISGNRVVAVLATGAQRPQIASFPAQAPAFTLGNATVYLQNLHIIGSTSNGVDATGTRLWVDSSHISGQGGDFCCALHHGIEARSGADITVRNTFIGSVPTGSYGIRISSSHAKVLYSSIAVNTTIPLSCTNPGVVEVRNSILATYGSSAISCPQATVTATSLTTTPSSAWFTHFSAGDLHLTATGATQFEDIAVWQPGDPPFDIDGDLRPAIGGASDFAGADVP